MDSSWIELASRAALRSLQLAVATAFTCAAISVSSADSSVIRTTALAKEKAVIKDEYSYLEDAQNQRAQAWVRAQNERASAELDEDPRFQRYYQWALDSEEGAKRADTAGLLAPKRQMWLHRDRVYQLWSDVAHPRGIWRRASLASFLKHKPEWEVLLDVDALSTADEEDWTFVDGVPSPNGRRYMVRLLRGAAGGISTWREFDLEQRTFVKGGFQVPISGSELVWRDDNTLIISTNLLPDSINAAGRPLAVKAWRRGQALADAKDIFRGRSDDLKVLASSADSYFGGVDADASGTRIVHLVRVDSANNMHWWRLDADDRLVEIKIPPMSNIAGFLYQGHYLLVLKDDWENGGKTWKKGSVVSVPVEDSSRVNPRVYSVISPGADTNVQYLGAKTRAGVLFVGSWLNYGRLWRARFENGAWVTELVKLPDQGVAMTEASDIGSDTAFLRYESVLHPPALYQLDMGSGRATLFASSEVTFNTDDFVTEQFEAKSADGILVPYFVARPKAMKFDGRAPTLVVAYGSKGGTYYPAYSGTTAKLWLEQGGVYVIANIRGGRERGPEWAVEGVNRRHTYEDMVAVTEDLIRRKVTGPKRIGFMGYSAGGLLGGVMFNQRPDLFGAVVLRAPVLDQFRLDLVVGGPVAWAREFGSLQVAPEREFLQRTSPFQNLKPDVDAPRPLLLTCTTDENVFPSQVRRFAAKMESLEMPFLFYETADGGHALAVTPVQRAKLDAMIYTYLARELIDRRAGS